MTLASDLSGPGIGWNLLGDGRFADEATEARIVINGVKASTWLSARGDQRELGRSTAQGMQDVLDAGENEVVLG